MIVSGNLVSMRNIISNHLAFEKWSPSKTINATCERKVTCSQCLSKTLFGINEIFWCSQAYPDTTRDQNLLDLQNVYRYERTNFCNYISQTGTCDSWNDQEVIEKKEWIDVYFSDLLLHTSELNEFMKCLLIDCKKGIPPKQFSKFEMLFGGCVYNVCNQLRKTVCWAGAYFRKTLR